MSVSKLLLLLLILFASASIVAAPVQNVTLADGSVMRAEVIALDDGVYTLRSSTLGVVQMPAENVVSISSDAAAAAAPAAINQVDEIRRSLIEDPEAMRKIQALQNDPLVRDILNDEETMRAISAGNFGTLLNNPKIRALMEHSTVRELTQGDIN